jgi:hypothetical protein
MLKSIDRRVSSTSICHNKRMKSWNVSEHSCRMLFLVTVTAALVLLAGCASSNNGAASGDATAFEDGMSLTGYSIQSKDGHTEMELRWTALRKPAADYIVYVHALDSSGAIAFQADHPLKNAIGSPTSSWAAGEKVTDRFLVIPAGGHLAGMYPLRFGLYTPAPMRVLQITRTALPMPSDVWKDHSILLAQVECK